MLKNLIKVLIIDDDDDSCDGVKVLLSYHEKYKFLVEDCKTLKDSLKLNLNNYDIIILDMILPDSKGTELYKTIASSTNSPIMILSGYPGLAVDAAKAGAQSYLIKPVGHDILIQTIIFTIEKYKLINKIKTEEKRFKMVMEGTSDPIIIYTTENKKDFKIINMNSAAEKLEKISRKNVIGKYGKDVFPYIGKYKFDELFERVYRTGKPFDDKLKEYDDGTWRTNYIYKLPSDDIVNICYDQTKVINILKELEEKEKMLRCSFNFNRDIIFITDMDHNILDRNRSFNKFLKYHYLNDMEINDKKIWKDLKLRDKFLNELQRNGQNLNEEVIFLGKNGEKIYCIVSAYILENKIYYFVHDVTIEKKSKEFMSKSSDMLSDIMKSKVNVDLENEFEKWKEEENVRIVLRKEKINEIDNIIKDIQNFSGEK